MAQRQRTDETWDKQGVLIERKQVVYEVPISEELTEKAEAAIQSNITFLALPSPNNTQIAAQVRLLTRENTAILRLLLNRLESTEGT